MPKLSGQSLLLPHQVIHLVLPQMLHYQVSVDESCPGVILFKNMRVTLESAEQPSQSVQTGCS